MNAKCKSLMIVLATVALGACASSVGSGGTSQGVPLDQGGDTPGNVDKAGTFAADVAVIGGFSGEIDGAKHTVDYTDPTLNEGLVVEAGLTHRISATSKTCVPALTITIARKDTSCKLELEYKADFFGELKVAEARFHAKAALLSEDGVPLETYPCAGWTEEPKKGQVIYDMVGGDAGIDIGGPLDQPYASQAEAHIPKLTMKLKGTIVMRFAGREFDLPLDTLSFEGAVISKGGPNVSCAQEFKPLPDILLEDFNPKSPTFGQKFDFNDYKGKRMAVLMGAGWCASCISQAEYMEKIKQDFTKQGRDDFVMVVINAESASSAPHQKAMLGHAGKEISFPALQALSSKEGWGAFGGKKNDCFMYFNNGQLAFKHIGKATVQLGQFDTEVRNGLSMDPK